MHAINPSRRERAKGFRSAAVHIALCLAVASTIKDMTHAGECWAREVVY